MAGVVKKGQTLRIIDLRQPSRRLHRVQRPRYAERYSAPDTIAAQKNIFLHTGTKLMSNEAT